MTQTSSDRGWSLRPSQRPSEQGRASSVPRECSAEMVPEWSRLISTPTLAFLGVLLGLSLLARPAHAIPAFAEQTGLNCSACHEGFPQLNAFGRAFKLNGYVLGGSIPSWKNFAGMVQMGWSHFNTNVPGGAAPATVPTTFSLSNSYPPSMAARSTHRSASARSSNGRGTAWATSGTGTTPTSAWPGPCDCSAMTS